MEDNKGNGENNRILNPELQDKIDELAVIIDKSKLKDYVDLINDPLRLIYVNFIMGLARGLGMAIGFSALAALVFYILRSWVNLPLIGQGIAKLLDIIDAYR
ncbi:hypothetical protein SAMN02745945_00882 [Peptoclostridium litorale DSM 5388]|uniref:Uncharacterized protein n=1 Tax=Peptoclostridium litorale DSM 5388 TaxID=1121324 RepID=A0A069RBR1_PEPLI|nr:DUF5665 domain-containing protein [Peptoclostridium litorale]KDR94198.1 hypothetical protein CLIT_23c04710 [Peptoclostridium litorale DSM 5388]SIN82169.1 hypothetical protein SAMN02745945_00882 [Peptoclostridium litorale DSM 5388]